MTISIAAELKELVDAEIRRVLPEVVAFRHERHKAPELSWQEEATARAVAGRLGQIAGIEVTERVGRLGVVGRLQGARPGPTVALRADMDGLPVRETSGVPYASCKDGVMHACGHDGHMANLYGAALVLAKLRDRLPGQVKLIFQPAEEGGAGADVMCDDGVTDDVDVIFGLHGWPELACGHIYLGRGPFMAATAFINIKVKGTGCHAAMPHLGTDQVLIAARIVEGLQGVAARMVAPYDAVVVSITKIHGGTTHNVIPPFVELGGTLRTLTAAVQEKAEAAIKQIATGIAATYGATAEVEVKRGYPATVNHKAPTEFLAQVASEVLPAGAALPIPAPSMGGEDFAYYLQRIPGAYFFLGVGDGRPGGYPSLHHPQYDFNDAALPVGIRMFVHAALAYGSATT